MACSEHVCVGVTILAMQSISSLPQSVAGMSWMRLVVEPVDARYPFVSSRVCWVFDCWLVCLAKRLAVTCALVIFFWIGLCGLWRSGFAGLKLKLRAHLFQSFFNCGGGEGLVDSFPTSTALVPTSVWLPSVERFFPRLATVLDKLLLVLFGLTFWGPSGGDNAPCRSRS